jgi:hypothetical protein
MVFYSYLFVTCEGSQTSWELHVYQTAVIFSFAVNLVLLASSQ